MNAYEILLEDVKNVDPTTKKNNFTKLITIRTTKTIKGNLILISRQSNIPYAKICRYAVTNLDSRIPLLSYKQMLENNIKPMHSKSTTSIRFWVNMELDGILEKRKKQLKTNKQDLVNLILNIFIEQYRELRSEYLINQKTNVVQ